MIDAGVSEFDAREEAKSNEPCVATEGQRIKFKGQRDQAGAWLILDPYDSELHALCYPRDYAGDGNTYCVPFVNETAYFSDAACSTPFAVTLVGGTPSVAAQADFSSCRGEPILYRVGAELAEPPTEAYYRNEDNVCQVTNVPGQAQARFFAATGPMMASEFVALDQSSIGSLRITQDVFEGSDQSRMCGTPQDTQLDFPCALEVLGPMEARCIPRQVAQTLYTEADCTGEIDTLLLGACPQASATHALVPSQCQTDAKVHALEAPELASYYSGSADSCFPIGDAQVSRFAAVGTAISSNELASLSFATDQGAGRLQRYSYQEEGGLAVLAPQYRDTMLELNCRPQAIGDGSRCLPTSAKPLNHYYSDSTCTTELRGVEVPCATEAPLFAFDGAMQAVITLASETTQAYRQGGDGCQLWPVPVLPTTVESRPYADFALLELVDPSQP